MAIHLFTPLRHALTTLAIGLSLLLAASSPRAQVSEDSPLFAELAAQDSLLFSEGFNECNLAALERSIAGDLEFYHDQGGVQDRAAFLRAVEESICSSPERKPIRLLVPGTLEVFPLYDNGDLYGAIQRGRHDFYIREPGRALYKTASAPFTHTWLRADSTWLLSRVLSYNHTEPAPSYGPQFDANHPEPLFTTDEDILALLRTHHIPSLGVGVLRGGALQQVRVFGETSAGHPAGYDTVYKVASLAKPVTALVVLKLVDAGLWDLDAPMYRFHTDADVADDARLPLLTTRHILSHQSGFPNWRHLTESGRLSFEFEPGTRHQYSGEGFEYLRRALEARFGRSLADLAREYVFEPLAMTRTSFTWADWAGARYAVEHDEAGAPITFERHTEVNAAANLLTTVGDYGTFMAHLLGGAGLSEDLFAEFVRPEVEQKPGVGWGLGVQVLTGLEDEEFALQHTGGDYGLKALAILLPESGRGLLILSNSENGMVLWRKLAEEYLGAAGEEIVRRNLE